MIKPQSISEHLLFCTVRISTKYLTGTMGSGTGFVFELNRPGKKTISFIITNKHVVDGANFGSFMVHESMFSDGKEYPSENSVEVQIDNFSDQWFRHKDNDIDLCAFPIQSLIDESSRLGRKVYFSSIGKENILSDDDLLNLSALEDVVMVGYPIGLTDQAHNLPILRRGTTASHSGINFDGRNEAVVDLAVFPGSSGSPILIVNEGSYHDHKGGSLMIGNRVVFLGVLHAGPIWNSEGEIKIVTIPTSQRVIANFPILINLGFYVKAKEVVNLCEQACDYYRFD